MLKKKKNDSNAADGPLKSQGGPLQGDEKKKGEVGAGGGRRVQSGGPWLGFGTKTGEGKREETQSTFSV